MGIGRVLKRAICSFLDVLQPSTCIYDLCCLLNRSVCYLRWRFEEQFADCTGRTKIGDTGAFYFDDIGAEDVEFFLEADIQIIPFPF